MDGCNSSQLPLNLFAMNWLTKFIYRIFCRTHMTAICIAYYVKSSKSEMFCSDLWIDAWDVSVDGLFLPWVAAGRWMKCGWRS